MNSIKSFVTLLETKTTKEAWAEMTSILKESHQYFQNIPTSERGHVLNVLFNERTGIVKFLYVTVDRPQIGKLLEGTIIQMFELLIYLICEFYDVYAPHIKTTQDVCTFVLTIKNGFWVKSAAAKALKTLIKTFESSELDFDDIVKEWVKKFKYYELNERRFLLEVVAAIARHFPQTPAFAGRGAELIRAQLMADIRMTCDRTKPMRPSAMTSYVESMSNFLHNFPPSHNDVGKDGGPDVLYDRLKNFCTSDDPTLNAKLMPAIVNFFAEHMMLFDDDVYKDYEFWHDLFKSFVKEKMYGEAATRALRMYYRTMGIVLGRKNTEDDQKVFLNLRDAFVKNLSDARLGSIDLRLTVYGFSQIIEPCRMYFADAGVEEMFSLIAHRTIPRHAREDDESAHFEEIADYQEALSRIIRYMPNVTIDQIHALTTLCSLLIKRFPELSPADQEHATASLNRTIVNVRYTKDILNQEFISHVVYDGIVWSCSHMLLIDAELQRDVEKSSKRPITYKDYVPLWRGLLNPANYSSNSENSEARAAALRRVADEAITTCVTLMNTLNLSVKSKEHNVSSDVKISQTVENESDFRIFLNLVDLYVEILGGLEHFLWTNTLRKFIYEIVRNSYKNPLISGFYKLANVALTSSGAFAGDEDRDAEMFDLVLRYLWNTLDSVAQYPPELQISCLRLILNVPEAFVKRIVERAAPAFKISFAIGLTNYEVATSALNALERWIKILGRECPKDFVGQLVPCLERFLQSEESAAQLLHDIEETKRRRVKKVTLLDDELSVEGFQKRILLFFGSLDGEVMHEFVHSRSLRTGATWSKKDLLRYSVPFPDVNLEISLDSLLPRVVELALSSGDRRTRVTASEVLHTAVALIVGKTLYDRDRFAPLYEILCPALLRLGCDADSVITQLYNPLMLQLTHWLSSAFMLDSRSTIHLVDSLFDGLGDETNSSLRDVSGIYLAEFVAWSIKQSTDEDLACCPTNINLIVHRILNFAVDPSSSKRVAAAIAFNHLYRILRENEEIVDVFWFEFLHAFVRSLDGCDDARIRDAVAHVERVLVEKSHVFNEANSRRRRPPGFAGSRAEDAAAWILEQCGSIDRGCRRRCAELFQRVARSVDGAGSAKAVIAGYLKSKGLQGLNSIVLRDLSAAKIRGMSVEALEIFLRTLDLYVWLLRENLVDHETLFGDANPRRIAVFEAIGEFVALLVDDRALVNQAIGPREFARLKTLQCEIVLTIFDFVPLALKVKAEKANYVPDFALDEPLFKLVSLCLLEPQRIGFDSGNLQLTEELPVKLEGLLVSAIENLSEAPMEAMKAVLANDIQRFSSDLFQFDRISSGQVSISERSVKGLILLHKCGLLKQCSGCQEITASADAKIRQIFETLRAEELWKKVCVELRLEVKTYFDSLIELLLLDYDVATMRSVVDLLTNTDRLFRSDLTTTVTHGEYFQSVFKDVVLRGCLRDVEKTLSLLETSIHANPDNVLRIAEALVLYLQRRRSEYREILDESADLVMRKFSVFERAVNDVEHRRNVFLNIYAVVVRLKRTPLDVFAQRGDLYQWILRELVDCDGFKRKIRLLRDFLVCLTDENSGENQELRVILYSLKAERRITCPDDPAGRKFASPETVDCFQTLLKLLPITRSPIVFDAVVKFAQGAGKLLCEDKVTEYLKLYYAGIRPANALKSLQLAYKIFVDSTDVDERLDALSYFLLPSFALCDPQTVEAFFADNIGEICATIAREPTDISLDRRRLFVSKIGCFNLLEIMFASLPNERIDGDESAIGKNARNEAGEEKLSKWIFRSSTLKIRQLESREGDDAQIFRRMQCAAYNCSITIYSMTKNERFCIAIFGENRAKRQLIWENIVDVGRKYELQQTSKEYPKERRKLVNIRRSEKERRNFESYSYVKSYDLATSTLSENICAYDLNAVNLMAQSARGFETMSLTLEIDDLNNHECMAPICALLIHMTNNENSRPADARAATTPPKWMSLFRDAMRSEHANVRLFMLKIVLNTQAVFKPHAESFLEPIVNTIYLALKNGPLNYVITDALVMLVDWRDVAVPKTERCRNFAQLMFTFLLEKGTAAPTKYIVRYNLSIIEMIVDAWPECLRVPEGLKERMANMDRLAVQLILIFLTKGMAEEIRDRDDVWEFLHKCLADWKIEEAAVLQNFEAVGLMLRHSASRENLEELRRRVVESARNAFRGMQSQNPGRLVKCVHALCKACPDLTEEFFQFVSSNQKRVEHAHMVRCLEVFSLMIPKLSPEEIVKELNYMQFNALLENKVLSCEKVCLQIVEQLVPILEPAHLLPMVELVSLYADHEIPEYRKICYDVAKKLYEKYSGDETARPEVLEIGDVSKRILLSGLLDPAEDVQKLATDFWSDAPQIRSECADRLLDILAAYTPGVEKNFLQIMTVMLLQLTRKSPTYNDKMFEPLHNCAFHDLPIYPSHRYNLESRIPLFAPSLASHFTQRFSHSSCVPQSPHDFMLRATNAPQFEATFLGERSMPASLTDDGNFAVPKVPEIHKYKVSQRFLVNGGDAGSSSPQQKRQAAKRFEEVEYRREYLARQRGSGSVKLYRKYKTGDFPHIEISHAAVLGPMQELAKRDPTICRSLVVSLIRSLIDRNDSALYAQNLSARLASVLEKRRRNGPVIPAILEILFNVRKLDVPWEIVTDVARNDRLFAQGAILTERTLRRRTEGATRRAEDAGPPAKRPRMTDDSTDRWIELAGLYESMNEVDVVLSVFRGEMFGEDLHAASAARAAAEWEKAEVSYRKAYDAEAGTPIGRHCLRGMFECMSRLSKWRKLEGEIDAKVKPNFATLLDDDSRDDRWIAPWVFRTQTRRIVEREANDAFVEALQTYLQDAAKCRRLKELYGEETAVMVIAASPDISRDFLNGSCEKIREEWIQLSPLAVPLRSAAIVKLQGIHDIDCYLRTIESPDIVESSRALLTSWQNSGPSTSDDLLAWDKHLAYRSHFTTSLIDKLRQPNADSQEAVELAEKLRMVRAEKTLRFVDCALSQRNAHVAKKYLRNIGSEVHSCNDQDLVDEFSLQAVKLKYLIAETSEDETKSLRDYAASWSKAHEILRGEDLSVSTKVAVRRIISTMSSSLADLSANRSEFFDRLTAQSNSTIVQDVSEDAIFDNVGAALDHYSFSNLRKCCEIAENVGECHLRLSKYCYDKIAAAGGENPELPLEFVRSTLRAMSCGSDEATHYFPCLLRHEFLSDEATRQVFSAESARVETWRFLVWQTQLLSHLGTPIGALVLPIIERIAKSYPNALVYSLRLTLDTKPHLCDDPAILKLADILEDRKEFNRFLEAIQYVVQPELYLEYHLRELSRNLPLGRATVVDSLMRKVWPANNSIGGRPMQGNIYRSIAPFRQEIAQMVEMPVEEVEKRVVEIIARLQRSLAERRDKNRLKDYSPWLQEFVGRDIEVPGQYGGDRRPIPRHHARIVKIESAVRVMRSKRKPIRVMIVANDARSYRFLVKFGEDLRLDQRVEQIFGVMNKTLRADFSCAQRRLSVDTYQVFPLSGSLGFLQWVDGTKTLRDFVDFSLDEPGKKLQHQIAVEYDDWVRKSHPGGGVATRYKKSLLKRSSAETIARMTNFHERIGGDLLRETFALLSPSMESFMSLRRNFTTSYATMCVAQWILGIGDRHLENTLISVESGRSLGIDFGSAFGGAVDQSVPELVPFRLTAQIQGLLKPFNENDLMGATMTHVLRALRNGKGPLLACLNVVAHEQLNWEEHVNRLSDEMQDGEAIDVKWLPAKKVAIVSKKLNGGKPSSITLEQLSERHSDKDYFYRYADVVNGTDADEKAKRSFLGQENLSPEEQVECLIEQATDLNVLGRMYAGWTPWL